MTYTAQERMDIAKKSIESNAKQIELNGVSYPISPVTTAGLKAIDDVLIGNKTGQIDSFEAWIQIAFISISRVLPDVSIEELRMVIDASNFDALRTKIFEVSGYLQPKEKDPNAQVATETQTEEIHLPNQTQTTSE